MFIIGEVTQRDKKLYVTTHCTEQKIRQMSQPL